MTRRFFIWFVIFFCSALNVWFFADKLIFTPCFFGALAFASLLAMAAELQEG